MTLRNVNGSSFHHLPLSYADIRIVRHQDTDIVDPTLIPQSIEGQTKGQWFPDQPSNELPQIDTRLGGRRSVGQSDLSPKSPSSVGQSDLSPKSPSRKSRKSRRGRTQQRTTFGSQLRYASPETTIVCDGWCKFSDVQYANIVSIGCALQGRSDVMLARSYLCQRARTGNAHGKAQTAR